MSDPYIIDLKWGQITIDVNGCIKTYRDCLISSTHCSIWNQTCFRHSMDRFDRFIKSTKGDILF